MWSDVPLRLVFAESGHHSSQPMSKSSSSASLYSAGSEGTAIFGQSNRASASSSNTDLASSLPTHLHADGLDNFNPFFPISLLQWVQIGLVKLSRMGTNRISRVNSHVTYHCRPVTFGSSSFSEVQKMGELGCIWKKRAKILPALSLT